MEVVPKNAGGSATGCSESSFTTIAPPGYCLTSPNGQWPGGTAGYTPETCDGLTENTITTAGYAGEYSLVNVLSNLISIIIDRIGSMSNLADNF